MRDIKFRFFDNNRNVMIKGDDLDIANCNIISECLTDDEDYICMQYTGLKDVNGIDIYEGNKIKVFEKDFEIDGTFVVEFKNGMYGVQEDKDFTPLYMITDICTVVGNIYEDIKETI